MNIYTTNIEIKTPWRVHVIPVQVAYAISGKHVDLLGDIDAVKQTYSETVTNLLYGSSAISSDFTLQFESDIQKEIKAMLDQYAAEVKAAGSVA